MKTFGTIRAIQNTIQSSAVYHILELRALIAPGDKWINSWLKVVDIWWKLLQVMDESLATSKV